MMLNQSHIGFPCPACTAVIRPTMPQIFSGSPIYCSGCGLKLQVDLRSSADSLRELEKLEQRQEEVEALLEQATRFSKPLR